MKRNHETTDTEDRNHQPENHKKSTSQRVAEFVDYHKNGDGECNGILLKAYADEKRLSAEERFALAYFYSLCYCIPSAIIMFDQREQIQNDPEKWATLHKQDIIFQSDRRYVRCGTTFHDMLRDYTQRIERQDFQDKCVHKV